MSGEDQLGESVPRIVRGGMPKSLEERVIEDRESAAKKEALLARIETFTTPVRDNIYVTARFQYEDYLQELLLKEKPHEKKKPTGFRRLIPKFNRGYPKHEEIPRFLEAYQRGGFIHQGSLMLTREVPDPESRYERLPFSLESYRLRVREHPTEPLVDMDYIFADSNLTQLVLRAEQGDKKLLKLLGQNSEVSNFLREFCLPARRLELYLDLTKPGLAFVVGAQFMNVYGGFYYSPQGEEGIFERNWNDHVVGGIVQFPRHQAKDAGYSLRDQLSIDEFLDLLKGLLNLQETEAIN